MKFEYDKKRKNVLTYEMPVSLERLILRASINSSCLPGLKEAFGENDWICELYDHELSVLGETESEAAVLIACEIAALSREMGYPVMLCGPESGLLTAYFLGASNVHPEQYGCGEIPLYFFSARLDRSLPPRFEIAVAEPVRERILPRLEKRFGGTEPDEGGKGEVTVSSYRTFDLIGKLASATGVPFACIRPDTPELAAAVRDDIINEIVKEQSGSDALLEYPYSYPGPAGFYSFARCSSNVRKDSGLLWSVRDYCFRDSVFSALVKTGIDAREAYGMSRLWSRAEKRKQEIAMLCERGAPEQLIKAFRYLTNLWTRTECLSRTYMMQTLKYYGINFPDEYGKIAGA